MITGLDQNLIHILESWFNVDNHRIQRKKYC